MPLRRILDAVLAGETGCQRCYHVVWSGPARRAGGCVNRQPRQEVAVGRAEYRVNWARRNQVRGHMDRLAVPQLTSLRTKHSSGTASLRFVPRPICRAVPMANAPGAGFNRRAPLHGTARMRHVRCMVSSHKAQARQGELCCCCTFNIDDSGKRVVNSARGTGGQRQGSALYAFRWGWSGPVVCR